MLVSNPWPTISEEAALGSTEPLEPQQSAVLKPSATALIKGRRPALLRGTAVDTWPARSWTWNSLAPLLEGEQFVDVTHTVGSMYLPADRKAALDPLLNYPELHEVKNMSANAFFAAVEETRRLHEERPSTKDGGDAGGEGGRGGVDWTGPRGALKGWRSSGKRLVYFGDVPLQMRDSLEPQEWLYPHADDAEARMQYLWLSTPGVRTHTHFDSDPNFFVQLIGRKRFVLWEPRETARLCPFPRLHPLWHKSRVDFEAPDLSSPPCSRYNESHALVTEVGPRGVGWGRVGWRGEASGMGKLRMGRDAARLQGRGWDGRGVPTIEDLNV